MDWNTIVKRLTDLPRGYLRIGPNFQQFQNSLTAGLVLGTSAYTGLTTQLNFDTAAGNWLDVWGQLFNLPRNTDEIDFAYQMRIKLLLRSGKGTAPAIEQYVNSGLGYANTTAENFSKISWTLTFLEPLTVAQYTQVAKNLVNIRPAGIPFLPMYVPSGGLYLDTINYLDAPSVTGAYLINSSAEVNPVISATTLSAQSTLPTTYLIDPTLNPSL